MSLVEISAAAVVIPARNEEELIERCLVSVLQALEPLAIESSVIVVGNRCIDDTVRIARRLLGSKGIVVVDASPTVVGARRRAASEAIAMFGHVPPSQLMLLSTDADSEVPLDWATRILDRSRRGAHAIGGLVEIDDFNKLKLVAQREYALSVARKITGESHTHTFAANLAVRADAYLSVGGWRDGEQGEDVNLFTDLNSSGFIAQRPTDVTVKTSGRLDSRASHGFGTFLRYLNDIAKTAR